MSTFIVTIGLLQRPCLGPMAVDVIVGRRAKDWVAQLRHPEAVSGQLVPIAVGDIQHGRDIHRAILLMSLKWHTVIWKGGPEHVG